MAKEHPVTLRKGTRNPYGATFWDLKIDTTCDGRGLGGLQLTVNILTQSEGLCIAGNWIPWEDLHRAEEHARKSRRESKKLGSEEVY